MGRLRVACGPGPKVSLLSANGRSGRLCGHDCAAKTAKSLAALSAKPRRRLATIGAAAEYVDVHPRTVRRWIAAGRLPAYRVGPRLLKIDLNELEDMLRRIPVWQPPAR